MAITNGYATLAEYKAWATMRNSSMSTDATDDTVLENHIEAASRYIDRMTGKRFFVDGTDKTRYYTPDDNAVLNIDPISASPTSVSIDTTGLRSYTALTEDTDFELHPYGAALEGQPYTRINIITSISSYFWPLTDKGVKVIGKFGFPAVPADVHEATLYLTEYYQNARTGQVYQGKEPEDIPTYVMQVIENYRGFV